MATVADTPRVTTITLGSTTAGPFNVGFRLFDTSIRVYVEDDLLNPADYTLSATFSGGYSDAATVTLDTARTSGTKIRIESDLPPARGEDYTASDPGLARKLNIEQARLWSKTGDIDRDLTRRVMVPASFSGDQITVEAPVPNGYVIGNQGGTAFTTTTVVPPAPAVSRIRTYETMEDAIADGDAIVSAASSADVCVSVKGGQQNGDGGKCDFAVRLAAGGETVLGANGRRYGSEYRLFFGASDGAYTVWPDGVVNAVAFGMQAHEWSAGANSAAQALDSMAHNDALLLRSNHFIGTGGSLKFIIPPGEYTIRDQALNGTISTNGCAILGSGRSRTKIHMGHFTDGSGNSEWDDGASGPNPLIPGPGRIRFDTNDAYLRDTEIGELSFYGEHMCGRGLQIVGSGRIHDFYVEKCNDRPTALSNPSGAVWDAFDPAAFDGIIENGHYYQNLGTLASSYGQQRVLFRNLIAEKYWAELCCPDAARYAIIKEVWGTNGNRRDKAAGTPVAGLYDGADDGGLENEAAGNGGVSAIVVGGAGAEYVEVTDFHLDGISEDAMASEGGLTPANGRFAFAVRPKENPNSGKIIIANGTVKNARGVLKVQTMWDDDLASAQSGHQVHMANVAMVDISQISGCGEIRIDQNCTRVTVTGVSTDNDYVKVFGHDNFGAGNKQGTLKDTPEALHASCSFAAISPRLERDWYTPVLVGDTTTPAVLGDSWSIVELENGICTFQFAMLNINPAALTGTTEVRIALPYRSSADIINASPLIFGAHGQQITYTGTLAISIAANALYATLQVAASNANRTNIVPANISNNAELMATLIYPVTN